RACDGAVVTSRGPLGRERHLPVDLLAYPNGKRPDYSRATIAAAARAGYTPALTTVEGWNRPGPPPPDAPRPPPPPPPPAGSTHALPPVEGWNRPATEPYEVRRFVQQPERGAPGLALGPFHPGWSRGRPRRRQAGR